MRNFAPGVGLPRGFGRIWKSWGSRDTARRSRSVIDFAYDTDWTGLRNWTGFLAGLTSLPSLVAPFAPARCLPSTQSLLLLSISRVLYASGRYIEAYVHTRTRTYTYTYILNVSRSIHPRDEEGFPLVSLAGYVEGDWPRTSDLCDLRGRIYERSRHASSSFILLSLLSMLNCGVESASIFYISLLFFTSDVQITQLDILRHIMGNAPSHFKLWSKYVWIS